MVQRVKEMMGKFFFFNFFKKPKKRKKKIESPEKIRKIVKKIYEKVEEWIKDPEKPPEIIKELETCIKEKKIFKESPIDIKEIDFSEYQQILSEINKTIGNFAEEMNEKCEEIYKEDSLNVYKNARDIVENLMTYYFQRMILDRKIQETLVELPDIENLFWFLINMDFGRRYTLVIKGNADCYLGESAKNLDIIVLGNADSVGHSCENCNIYICGNIQSFNFAKNSRLFVGKDAEGIGIKCENCKIFVNGAVWDDALGESVDTKLECRRFSMRKKKNIWYVKDNLLWIELHSLGFMCKNCEIEIYEDAYGTLLPYAENTKLIVHGEIKGNIGYKSRSCEIYVGTLNLGEATIGPYAQNLKIHAELVIGDKGLIDLYKIFNNVDVLDFRTLPGRLEIKHKEFIESREINKDAIILWLADAGVKLPENYVEKLKKGEIDIWDRYYFDEEYIRKLREGKIDVGTIPYADEETYAEDIEDMKFYSNVVSSDEIARKIKEENIDLERLEKTVKYLEKKIRKSRLYKILIGRRAEKLIKRIEEAIKIVRERGSR